MNQFKLGEYSNGSVHFNSQITWPKRTEKWVDLCIKLMNILGVYDYGGHYGRSEWSNLNMFDIFSTFDINDSMRNS